MLNLVRKTNSFFRTATVAEINAVRDAIVLTERQTEIFERFYIKKQTVTFIGDTIGTSPRNVTRELNLIRAKIAVVKGF